MIDNIFNLSVQALYFVAGFFGITYEFINVLMFLILGPALTIGLIFFCTHLFRENCKLRGGYNV